MVSTSADDETRLREKLAKIEALFGGATTDGERHAAGEARARIQQRLDELRKKAPAAEFKFTLADTYSRRLFLALLRRYGLEPFRYRGQRRTTVMVRAPEAFVNETLWPEFEQLSDTLREYLDSVTSRVIAETIHADSEDAVERAQPPELGPKQR